LSIKAAVSSLPIMPIYILKRYHAVTPTPGKLWHLGREIAFEAADDGDAIAQARNNHLTDIDAFGGLAVLHDGDGRRVWQQEFP
jgi:hypothetical protein